MNKLSARDIHSIKNRGFLKNNARDIHFERNMKMGFPEWFRYHAGRQEWKPGKDYKKITEKGSRRTRMNFLVTDEVAAFLMTYVGKPYTRQNKKNNMKSASDLDKRFFDCRKYSACLDKLAFRNGFIMGCVKCTEYAKQEAIINHELTGMTEIETCLI